MNTVKIYRLDHLSHAMFHRLKAAQLEAAQVWNRCMETHKAARQAHVKWPGRNDLQKVTKGRNWVCKACGFTGHRDIVGSVNMHKLAYGSQVMFPRSVTYLRPGLSRRSSRADTPRASSDVCCLSESTGQPLRMSQVPLGTGHTAEVAQKPVSL